MAFTKIDLNTFEVGDLIYSTDKKTIGQIISCKQNDITCLYKINFIIYNNIPGNNPALTSVSNNLWSTHAILARIAAGTWHLQKCKK